MGDSRSDVDGDGVPGGAGRVLPLAAATAPPLTPTTARTSPLLPARLTIALATLATLAAIAHTWTHRYGLANLDGVSYLDVADAWRTAGWRVAVNGYWSPLYSWVLAATMAIVRPPRAAEYVLVHVVNLGLFVVSLAACVLFVRELVRAGTADEADMRTMTWSPAQLLTVSLVLWTWIALTQLVVWMESPDLLVAIATFIASAMLVKLRRSERMGDAFLFGVALGCGYLAKAAILPVSAVYLAAAAITARRRWQQIPIAIVGLAVVAAPWIATLSVVKGRLTMGDAGRLNYIWFVSHSRNWPHEWPRHWPHWDGAGAAGMPLYPDRVLLEKPAVYDLSTNTGFEATYPVWHDVSRSYEGVRVQPSVRDQLRRLRMSTDDVFRLLTVNFYQPRWMNPELPLLAIVIACFLAAGTGRRWRVMWALIVPGAATIGLYSLVYVAPRYLGAAICVMLVAAIAGVRLPRGEHSLRLLRSAASVGTGIVAFAVISATILECSEGWRRMLRGEPDEINLPWHVAALMHQAGIPEGAHVAIVGDAQVASRWARLARVKIVAEVPVADLPAFAASPDAVTAVLNALAQSSAQFVLAERVPPSMPTWRPIEGTAYWVLAR